MASKNKRVQVWGRFRPTSNFSSDIIELLPDGRGINIHKRETKKGTVNNQILDWGFKLDGIFHNSSQDYVYNTVASNIVSSALDGYNGTIMCYGQTGAGKTFTMTGATENYQHRGIIPRAVSQIFREIEDRSEHAITVRLSYLEIYNEAMYDLLGKLPEATLQSNPEPMTVTEGPDGLVYVKGLSCHMAQNEEEALNLLFEGETNRAIASHVLNKVSSRSHCILTIYIEARSRVASNAKYTVSKLNFVDLAGSERLSKTKSEGKTQQEATYINKSLTFLEQVIVALADRYRDHIPFRQSKLTHYLKDSIGGNCSTLLVANMWGERDQLEETVSTLRFAMRMMCVASEPAKNEVYDPALLVKKLQKEISHLKAELAMHDTLDHSLSGMNNRSQIVYDPLSEQQKFEIRQQVRKFLEGQLDTMDIINLRQIQGTYEAFREIYSQMEKDVEDKLRQRYALIDKADAAAIAAAQQAGVPIADDGSLVGETDGSGFGVGTAPKSAKAEPSAVVQLKKKEKGAERRRGGREGGKRDSTGVPGPTGGKAPSTPSQSAKGEREVKSPAHTPVDKRKEEDGDGSPSPPVSSAEVASRTEKQGRVSAAAVASSENPQTKDKQEVPALPPTIKEPQNQEPEPLPPPKPCTPPTRSAAFEEFKAERGSEINRILVENKDILTRKKKQYAALARKINSTKVEIDTVRQNLNVLKADREAEGVDYNEDGDIIISEAEFHLLNKLKDLKQSYHMDFDELKNLKHETQYCQKLVDQCRQRLIQEFDGWYSESFLNQNDESMTSLAAGHGLQPGIAVPLNANIIPEDEQEKFDRLQMELLMNNPESAAFYKARMRTNRRKVFDAVRAGSDDRRTPGLPTVQHRNKPPSMLQVQY